MCLQWRRKAAVTDAALVAANREMIARLEKKIQATLACVRGEETG